MTKEEVVKKFEPTGGPKLEVRSSMLYLRTENTFKDAATDILEYVAPSDQRDEALVALYEARQLCLAAVMGEKKAEAPVKKVDPPKKKSIFSR